MEGQGGWDNSGGGVGKKKEKVSPTPGAKEVTGTTPNPRAVPMETGVATYNESERERVMKDRERGKWRGVCVCGEGGGLQVVGVKVQLSCTCGRVGWGRGALRTGVGRVTGLEQFSTCTTFLPSPFTGFRKDGTGGGGQKNGVSTLMGLEQTKVRAVERLHERHRTDQRVDLNEGQ